MKKNQEGIVPRMAAWLTAIALGVLLYGLAGCGAGPSGPPAYTIGGSVSGLAAGESVTLADNVTDLLTVSANGAFTFRKPIDQGGSYSVTVTTQPPGQSCSVSHASGSNLMAPVNSVAVSCSNLPQYAYVVNNGSDTLSQYSIGTKGTLTPLTPATVATGHSPESVTVDPTHHYVYVANLSDDTVSQYVIQPDGTLAANSPATVATGSAPWAMAIGPSGEFAYVVNSQADSITQFALAANGTLGHPATPIVTGSVPWNITLAPNGNSAYVSFHGTPMALGNSVGQYSISAAGALAALNPPTVPSGTSPSGVAVDRASAFAFVANLSGNSVSQYSIAAGGELAALTPPTVTTGSGPIYVAIDPSNKYVYVADYGTGAAPGAVSQYDLDASGLLTPMSTASVSAGAGPVWIAFDNFGKFAYVVNETDGTVSEYALGADGSLTALGVVAVGSKPFAIATSYVGS